MKHTLYHGSPNIIVKPEYGTGNVCNDFGQAFYCTENSKVAKEWAVDDGLSGYVNCYSFEDDGLKVLDLLDGNYHILNWLALLMDNRKFRVDTELKADSEKYILETFLVPYGDYDCIVGYRADDSYFALANAFFNNAMTLEKVFKLMKLGKEGEQWSIRSKAALERMEFSSADRADCVSFYPARKSRDEKIRDKDRKLRDNIVSGTFLVDIIREEWGNDDGRLQRMLHS